MATTEEVKKLAALARIKVEDAELETFTKEFDSILAYVETIPIVEMPHSDASWRGLTEPEKPSLRNIMREDGEPHAPGAYTEKLAAQFPARLSAQAGEGTYLEVKQIISHE